MLTQDWLMVVGTILIAWLVLEAIVYRLSARREADAELPLGFGEWLAPRLGRNWPLLVLLLVCTAPIALTEGRWALTGAAVVLAWWVAEAIAVRPMPPTRNPVALFALSMCRLWRNRGLVRILVASWIASAMVAHLFYIRYYQMLVAKGTTPASAEHARLTIEVVKVFPTKLARALPQVKNLSLGHFGDYALVAILAVGLIWLWVKRPAWLSPDTRKRLRWPLGFTVACALCQGAYLAYAWDAMWAGASLPGPRIADPLFLAGAVVLASPAYALLWHVGVQVARGHRWNLRNAVEGMALSWAPVCVVQLLITLPTAIMLLLTSLRISGMSSPVYQVGVILEVVLALAPWIIMDQAVGFRAAVVESYRLASRHAYDLLVFALRFIVMFAVPAAVLGLLTPRGFHTPTPVSMIGYLARDFFLVAQALVIATLYLELRREREAVEPTPSASHLPLPQ